MRGRTLAGSEVHDSRITGLRDAMKDGRRPALLVSVEDSDQQKSGLLDGLLGRPAVLTMLVQAAVFELQKVQGGKQEQLEFVLGDSDAAFEATLNLMDRQWRMALSDPGNAWAEVLRGLLQRVGRVQDIRIVDPESGRRHAARITQVELHVIEEPDFGGTIAPAIEAGLALMEASTDYADLAGNWRILLAEGNGLEDWQKTQASLFGSRTLIDALGLSPLASNGEGFTSGTIEITGLGSVTEVGDNA